ncbi:MAG TPA: hypothetical protein VNT76_04110 [Candidatus Binatus sp.]|nr:hypothetical protein [Candidatus Binatus sp.]
MELEKRLFVGLKITKDLKNELDSPAANVKHYFDGSSQEYLQIVSIMEAEYIGRYLTDGFPVTDISDVSRNVRSILKLISKGRYVEEKDVCIYSC